MQDTALLENLLKVVPVTAWQNRVKTCLCGRTPTMAAGIANHIRTIEEVVRLAIE